LPVEVARSALGRRWRLRPFDDALALALSQRLGLPEIVGRIMAGRGVDLATAQEFLEPRLRTLLPDPSYLRDLEIGAARLADAIAAGEPIGIIGDYDVDGATSTALLVRYLRELDIAAPFEIPDRVDDGYGPNAGAFERLAAQGCRLVVTVDSGTTAFTPLAEARRRGVDVIVVDHHAAEATLPPAVAVINPNRRDQAGGVRDLAAVGVTFLLLVGLNRELRRRGWFTTRAEPVLTDWLDLVALGTVCDVMPLTGLNRAFVRQGLRVMAQGRNAGLRALAEAAQLAWPPACWQLGFVLGPRINAGGRIGRSSLGARLLCSTDASEAAGLAQRLHDLNAQRQTMEREQLARAEALVTASVARDAPVLIAADRAIHPGIAGLLAARLAERHRRPAVVIALDALGTGRGSGRSVPGFDLGAAVQAARAAGLLLQGGGHPMAAGLTVASARVAELQAFLVEHATTSACPVGAAPEMAIDAAVTTTAITPQLAGDLERLGPFGPGNPAPLLALTDARVVETRPAGSSHVSCVLSGAGGGRLRAIAFRARATPLEAVLVAGRHLHVAGRVSRSQYQGQERVELQIEDAAVPA
jgi:single-stranded-DNA-specific exonuclease